ncbi:hypothetical protein F5B22DRAFT_159780 [Xylaria bambusicola]|uniref:uncharacterized protein n=1 Tax=Xylaria bambusicola TaxID=326684 RepID=UPI002008E30A|nr:uncharacterized protein F5B22DRAFT_159780 [Xylaria bambusicola]KAI0526475.1 hypothetical protein F5B22DRAFT_159780 [Xylaria bambusicola]
MADDDSSELSSLSSLSSAPSEDDGEVQLKREKGILKFFHKLPQGTKPAVEPDQTPSPPPRKRSPSPPHDYVLADNPDIAFIVMFRSRFNEALPKSLANFGPQELERDVTESIPGERVEHFLCAVLGLLLNRKQDVKPGHYNRALEDAISSHKNQWARDWEDKSPLSGGQTFTTMNPTERLTLLRTLVLWTLSSSEVVKGIINQSYKQNRHEDDLNQPLSVQPWGADSDRRRYFLVEGLDDTHFRVYRESNPAGYNRTWWSVAGSIEELNVLSDKLQSLDGGPKARKLAQKMQAAIPRFEATEEKRKRREYRLMRKEQFKRPEPGFSMYEGRTRGKRMKYTYSDDEDFYSDSTNRRSARNTGTHTPAEPAGPVTTASGRQIKAPSRMTVDALNNIVTTSPTHETEDLQLKEPLVGPSGRPRRSAAVNHGTNGWTASKSKRNNDELDDDEDDSEPDLGDDEEDDHIPDVESDEEDDDFDDDEAMVDDDLDEGSKGSMVVKLKYSPKATGTTLDLDAFRYDGGDKKRQQLDTCDSEAKIGSKDSPRVEKSEESIDVATAQSQATPEPDTHNLGNSIQHPPETPALNTLQSTSLAIRESPEKTQQQSLRQSVDILAK